MRTTDLLLGNGVIADAEEEEDGGHPAEEEGGHVDGPGVDAVQLEGVDGQIVPVPGERRDGLGQEGVQLPLVQDRLGPHLQERTKRSAPCIAPVIG